ncbi:MAG TPA: zf-HC2 domain-containing protein [Candidatus Polarisedimenticolia bacterium]|nr:zf-HC2 domain-containing protein [Candidatus Polarisedimenticolia bacterium]
MNRFESTGCAAFLPLLPLHFYSGLETTQRVQLEAHLSACAECAAAWEETRASLAAVDSGAAFPREAEVDWDDFAARTVARARAAADDGEGIRVPSPARRRLAAWGMLAAAASLLLVAALRTLPAPHPAPAATLPQLAQAGEDAPVPAETTAYLEAGVARRAAARSLRDGRALLLDLLEAPVRCRREDGHFDVAVERARSRELLRRLAVQRRALEDPRDQRLSAVLGALSDLLLDVAEMDDCADGPQLRALKEAIERRQVLLRIDLMAREADEGDSRA